jgi:lysozyme
MKLIPDIRRKMRSYSIWALMLSLALFLLPEAFYAYEGRHLANPYTVGKLALFFGVFGIVGWFIDQSRPDCWRTLKLAGISLALSVVVWLLLTVPSHAMDRVHVEPDPPAVQSGLPTWLQTSIYAVPITAKWEGLETTAYLDRIARPPVWTVCFGETFDVTPREVRTEAECIEGLNVGLERYWREWRTGLTITTLAAQTDAAITTLSWNIGVGGVLSSTALRRLNAGNVVGACEAITWFNKAGGVFVRGLANRREDDEQLCLAGLA